MWFGLPRKMAVPFPKGDVKIEFSLLALSCKITTFTQTSVGVEAVDKRKRFLGKGAKDKQAKKKKKNRQKERVDRINRSVAVNSIREETL